MSTAQIRRALALYAITQTASAHTWVESIQQISSTGEYTGNVGYAMGYLPRSALGFSDLLVENQILETISNPAICKDFIQGNYPNPDYQPITASPGDFLSLQYAENGHVSFPTLTPRGFRGGNVMIYGTSQHSADTSINDVMYVWNEEGTGGNQQGKLLASHFFDDEQCFENPDGSAINTARRAAAGGVESLLCQGSVQLPSDLPTSGNYTLYWVWDWPQNPNVAGLNTTEIYTSCATVNLSPSTSNSTAADFVRFSSSKNVTNMAILSQLVTSVEVLTRGTGTSSPAAVTNVALDTTLSESQASTTTSATQVTSSKAAKTKTKTRTKTTTKTKTQGSNAAGLTKTVTVTAEVEIVTMYHTVTVNANGVVEGSTSTPATTLTTVLSPSSAQAAAATGPVTVTSVTPFLRARATGHVRRLR
ncbi:hypothetical protein BX600DRAFT_430075 [Xylariales sp. PMI_506]|nr:hypothetical protein BX600DRAFT_430075 [Xylariales sp. PMI_506]